MAGTFDQPRLDVAVARLDRWLDTMRTPDGYGGPVAHWWRESMVACRAGLDWRYEGIVAGYLTLFERTGGAHWLAKACRAGDDLVKGQLPGGHFDASEFQLNPGTAGTPHEAACDIALLLLARTLRDRGAAGWEVYLNAARLNLDAYYLGRLWSESEQRFRDDPRQPSFVPNKSATLIEALCLLADLTGREDYVTRYVRLTADAILEHRVAAPGSPLHGAIAQNSFGARIVEKYFPYYNARSVAGLLEAGRRLDQPRYVEAALDALRFAWRWRDPDGLFPQVVYAGGDVSRYPRWVAGLGDLLLAADLARPHGLEFLTDVGVCRLLDGQLASGGIMTAEGFASVLTQRPPAVVDVRDVLPVCGWVDKAFRFLTSRAVAPPAEIEGSLSVARPCRTHDRSVEYREDAEVLMLVHAGRPVYRWRKGTDWAEVTVPWAVTP